MLLSHLQSYCLSLLPFTCRPHVNEVMEANGGSIKLKGGANVALAIACLLQWSECQVQHPYANLLLATLDGFLVPKSFLGCLANGRSSTAASRSQNGSLTSCSITCEQKRLASSLLSIRSPETAHYYLCFYLQQSIHSASSSHGNNLRTTLFSPLYTTTQRNHVGR